MPNKMLAAQLWRDERVLPGECRRVFRLITITTSQKPIIAEPPDTFIEKDASVNEHIERMVLGDEGAAGTS